MKSIWKVGVLALALSFGQGAAAGEVFLICKSQSGDTYRLSDRSGTMQGWVNDHPAELQFRMTTGVGVFNDYEDCVGRIYKKNAAVASATIDFTHELPGKPLQYDGQNGVNCVASQAFIEQNWCNGQVKTQTDYNVSTIF